MPFFDIHGQNKLGCLTKNSLNILMLKNLCMISFYIHILMLKALVDGHGVLSEKARAFDSEQSNICNSRWSS